jgi:hypothetical protein
LIAAWSLWFPVNALYRPSLWSQVKGTEASWQPYAIPWINAARLGLDMDEIKAIQEEIKNLKKLVEEGRS